MTIKTTVIKTWQFLWAIISSILLVPVFLCVALGFGTRVANDFICAITFLVEEMHHERRIN